MATDYTTMKAPIPHVLECDASELASYLLHHRFQNDAMATASFLLECTSSLPNADVISAQLLHGDGLDQDENDNSGTGERLLRNADINNSKYQENSHLNNSSNNDIQNGDHNLGNIVMGPCEVSMTTPRGKFQWTLHERGIYAKNAKNDEFTLTANDVERFILFPKPEDCRKSKPGSTTEYGMALICVTAAAREKFHANKKAKPSPYWQVCFVLPTITTTKKKMKNNDVTANDGLKSWIDTLSNSLALNASKDVVWVCHAGRLSSLKSSHGEQYIFRSHDPGTTSTTTGGMPFVQCYHGVHDGVLYPLKEGLLFFRPPMFVHRSCLHSIACGRGSGESRYVDLVLTVENQTDNDSTTSESSSSTLEFTNIHRDELTVLNDYIHTVLIPAMTLDVAQGGNDYNDNDDENNDEYETLDHSMSTGKRSTSQRKASVEARQATRAQLARPGVDSENDNDDEEEEDWNGTTDDLDESESTDEEDDNDEEGASQSEQSSQHKMAMTTTAEVVRSNDNNDEDDEDEDDEDYFVNDGASSDEGSEEEVGEWSEGDERSEEEEGSEEEVEEGSDEEGTATESEDGEPSQKKRRSE